MEMDTRYGPDTDVIYLQQGGQGIYPIRCEMRVYYQDYGHGTDMKIFLHQNYNDFRKVPL